MLAVVAMSFSPGRKTGEVEEEGIVYAEREGGWERAWGRLFLGFTVFEMSLKCVFSKCTHEGLLVSI